MPTDKKSDDEAKPQFSQFLAVGRMGLRMTSPDGQTWSAPQQSKDPHTLNSIAAGNGCAVAVGMAGTGSNAFYRSADLQKWEVQTKPSDYVFMMRHVAFGGGQFMALLSGGVNGEDAGVAQLSSDGQQWGERLKRPKRSLNRVRWSGGKWYGIGSHGLKSVSSDGKEWQDAPEQTASDTLIDLACGKGVIVGVGLNGLRLSSPDGLRWGNRQIGEEGEHIHAVVFTGKEFVGVGLGATYTSSDGLSWTRKANKDAPVCCAYGRGVFVGAAYKGRIMVSKDAISWKQVLKCDQHVQAISYL